MKHQPMATANATALTIGVIYIVCALSFLIAPDLAISIGKSWFHGIDISRITNTDITVSSFILGLVTATGGGWLSGYLFASTYNAFLKK